MKLLHKLGITAVALATLSLASPAQARWWGPVFRGRVVVVGSPYYYGYYGPAYYDDYAPEYYGYYPYYYGGGVAFGGHGYYHGGYGYRGGYGGGYRGGYGGGGHHR